MLLHRKNLTTKLSVRFYHLDFSVHIGPSSFRKSITFLVLIDEKCVCNQLPDQQLQLLSNLDRILFSWLLGKQWKSGILCLQGMIQEHN